MASAGAGMSRWTVTARSWGNLTVWSRRTGVRDTGHVRALTRAVSDSGVCRGTHGDWGTP